MSPASRILVFVALAAPVLGGVWYFVSTAWKLRAHGGRIGVQYFGMPDLFMASSLGFFFAASGLQGLAKSQPANGLKLEQIWGSTGFMTAVLAVILVFAFSRRIPLVRALYLQWEDVPSSILRAALSLLSALPVIWAAALLWERLMPSSWQEQALVSLFRTSVETGDYRSVGMIAASALLGAPLQEEIIFRGFFYMTLKRYLGAVGATLLVSALFAVCHGYAGVIPGLVILSFCETVALERFGSLWVCIFMHACFNGLGLVQLYMEARGWMPH